MTDQQFARTPKFMVLSGYFGYWLLIFFGKMRNFFARIGIRTDDYGLEKTRTSYPELYQCFERFYSRHIFRPMKDCFDRVVVSPPGGKITFKDRTSSDNNWMFNYHDTTTECINMGSYNYLGFAEKTGPCTDAVEKAIYENACGVGSTRHECGNHIYYGELETMMAKFLGVEDCAVFGMGFATNSCNIPILAQKGTLILSDALNHASLILGSRTSRATIRIFKHDDMNDVEKLLKEAVIKGQPKTGEPWKKIIIIVEGIYSMEGSIANLPKLIELKHKYKAYLFVDEAHSIGALGSNGKGVMNFYGLNVQDVDVLMGTFTKSFSAVGGYIGGSKRLIDYIRATSHSFLYATSMPIPIAQQIITVLHIITETDEGKQRIKQLARNTIYFRRRLKQLGFIVYGNDHSPVVPMMVYTHSKMTYCGSIVDPVVSALYSYSLFPTEDYSMLVRTLLEYKIGAIGVAYPATPMNLARIRFCISAAHTKEMLDYVLTICDKTGDELYTKFISQNNHTTQLIQY